MKNAKQTGDILELTNGSGADLASGAVYGPIGTAEMFGVAVTDVADTEKGSFLVEKVVELAAQSADVWAEGDILYWDVADQALTDDPDAGTNKRIGVATRAKAASVVLAEVKLNA